MAEYEDINSGHDNDNKGATRQKYGGLAPKRKPLISKDNERAFFDSADWALGKQNAGLNQISSAAIETLQPKLKKTPHQRLPPRRPACVSKRDNHAE
uniref:cAMP-regulated phosphoprotein 19-related protein isoform 1 n=1 Tax=Tanacetum cinerariifolium TaxID=118510 RepID=A0A6L2LXS5_TANCI|nr:cAMP-regulated phosphoprotein 19-related protein isoform 1 [Tanacetum cinerariifolium]